MFRFFENLIDPFTPYDEDFVPSKSLSKFMWQFLFHLRGLFVLGGLGAMISAGMELVLIW